MTTELELQAASNKIFEIFYSDLGFLDEANTKLIRQACRNSAKKILNVAASVRQPKEQKQ